MKKLMNWLKSPASDFALFILLLILANVASRRAFLRFDLTRQGSYSLSAASVQTVGTLTEPLAVKVFFSDNLPSPYNGVAQYVRDILVEYKGKANRNFSYTFFDMDKPENQKIAGGYGLHQVQIREVKNNEVGFKQAWMGLAISYGDSIEVMDSITTSDGFEYKLTTKIAKMISTTDTLAGLGDGDAIGVTLFASDDLRGFGIGGFDQLDTEVQQAFNAVNRKNMNRLTYVRKNPPAGEIEETADRYGLQTLNWERKDGTKGTGVFGLVIEHGDSFRTIPFSIQRSLFGYVISGFDGLEQNLTESLQSLLSKSTEIGYVTGHGEAGLFDENGAATHFSTAVSDLYTFRELNLAEEDIPAGLMSVVINGPTEPLGEKELYKIDQFLMRGGNVMVFADPFRETPAAYYQPAQFSPSETNLSRLLDAYGVKLPQNYVFDEACYSVSAQNYGEVFLYWAPMLQKKQLHPKNPIVRNLGYVIFLQAGAVDVSAAEEDSALKVSVLAKSSDKSWTQSQNIQLTPMVQPPYDKDSMKAENLAVLLEGRFRSAFDAEPDSGDGADTGGAELSSSTHLSQSSQDGKLFVAGTSKITENQLIDADGAEPIAMLVRNAVDYMNGSAELCEMRTKGLSLNTLSNTGGALALFVKYFNQFGLAVLTAVAGLLVWRARNLRRKRIQLRYNPNDEREMTNQSKDGGK